MSATKMSQSARCALAVTGSMLIFRFANMAAAVEMPAWPADADQGWKTVRTKDLPPGVAPRNFGDPQQPLTTVMVRKADVDHDGILDLIVDTNRGGSGGTYLMVYRREGKRYREVLLEQGYICVRPFEHGVSRVECWSHGGGSDFGRRVYRYSRGQFVEEFNQSLRQRSDGKFEVTETTKPKAK